MNELHLFSVLTYVSTRHSPKKEIEIGLCFTVIQYAMVLTGAVKIM